MSSDNPGASTQPGEPSSTLGANANTTEVKEEELDASITANIASTDHQPDAMNLDGANDMDAQQNNQPPGTVPGADGLMPGAPPASELRIPTKKDASLREFLSKMDDYAPIVRANTSLNFVKERNDSSSIILLVLSTCPAKASYPEQQCRC